MKKVLIVSVAVLMTACSNFKYNQSVDLSAPKFGSDSKSVNVPDWYVASEKEPNAIYGVASEVSTDMQFAVDKAMLSAKRELASNFSSHIDSMMKDYTAQAGNADAEVLQEINRTTKLVVNKVNLIGVNRTHFKIMKEDKQYRAYVKVRYAVDDSNRILLEEIKKNRRLTHKLESSKAFKELDREVNGGEQPAPVSPAAAPVVEDKKVSEVNTIQLLPVDNEEYKKRRDEALKKEGAVIGQITVR
jgi:hypothetical protein